MEVGMKRGDLVTIVITGDYGKPRPALVIQDDTFQDLDSVTVLQLTSDVQEGPFSASSWSRHPRTGC
jgi:mRNA-degrading endonuclease toxin of MazEF toxin-antitoxin module